MPDVLELLAGRIGVQADQDRQAGRLSSATAPLTRALKDFGELHLTPACAARSERCSPWIT
jgi:hypothetical protein